MKPRLIDPQHFAPSLREAVPGEAAHGPVVSPDREHPAGACEKRARDWAACLQATARLSDAVVEEAEARASDAPAGVTRMCGPEVWPRCLRHPSEPGGPGRLG